MSSTLPELEPHCGSWIATASRGRVIEVFDRAKAQRLLDLGWTVETAAQYLGRINAEIKAGGINSPCPLKSSHPTPLHAR